MSINNTSGILFKNKQEYMFSFALLTVMKLSVDDLHWCAVTSKLMQHATKEKYMKGERKMSFN